MLSQWIPKQVKNSIGYSVSELPTKFYLAAEDLNESITRMFVGALREGISAGFEETLNRTVQDSSNTVVHWKVGVEGDSNPEGRELGSFSQLRGTKKVKPRHKLVGYKGDRRSVIDSSTAKAVADSILAQEISEIISQYAAGQKPATKFYFFNPNDVKGYSHNARVEEAGNAGLVRAVTHFDREVALGNTRRYRLK